MWGSIQQRLGLCLPQKVPFTFPLLLLWSETEQGTSVTCDQEVMMRPWQVIQHMPMCVKHAEWLFLVVNKVLHLDSRPPHHSSAAATY